MRLPEAAIEELLGTWPVARLATGGMEGRPHVVPVVFARARGASGEALLWSPIDGKPKAGLELERVRSIAHAPLASLLLDHYDVDWTRLWWLRVDATARIVRAADPDAEPDVARAVAALRAKYPQYERIPVLRDPPTLLALRPTAVRSWCAGPDAVPHP